jgi:cytoplasmic iron level regulating protein YaaA (DUF328/UPF0246 family)
MLVLLSPAKTLNPDRPDAALEEALSPPQLIKEANDIVKTLKGWSLAQTQAQLHLSDALATKVHAWHQAWTPEGDAVAGWTFRGDAFKSMDLPSLPHEPLLASQDRLRILHGVYGLLRPMDRFMPVRLEMGERWCHDTAFNNMASFWKIRLPPVVTECADALGKNSLILNLASAEYGDIALHGVPAERVVTCAFLERRNGQLKAISSFAKTARGAMARHVLLHDIHTPSELDAFNELGYRFSSEESTPNKKVFIRTLPT